MTLRIGIDTGGTFTDLVVVDTTTGRLLFHKVASTPDDPGRAVVEGLCQIAKLAGADLQAIRLLVHGTTVATNTVLQRAGARVGLITTAGFRDVLHIQRQDRPRMYDLRGRRARPLVARSLRLELDERMRYDGTVQRPIDHAQLDRLIARLEEEKVEAVAVGLLHSYANPTHEIEVGKMLAQKLRDATVSLSHELVGEHGEYERFSTCAMNAYVQPVIQRYLVRLQAALNQRAVTAPLFIMKSNGGVMSAQTAGRQCVQTILSGPAGGVVAGAAIATAIRHDNLITADMGGTSFDVSVIQGGRLDFAREAQMGGLALGVPMLDIHTVGAGGGSIGWIDAGRALRVGPRSAGARPGPVCYGLGGTEPTVTDANLVLGRLTVNSLLGGRMQLDLESARRAVHDVLGQPLGLSIEQAAEGMVRVVNATMTAAIRKLTVERGHDPRDFTLCAFGGAGPLHAAELAAEMGIAQVLVPIAPGVQSAVGLLMSNLREDRIRTHIKRLDETTPDEIETIFSSLLADAQKGLNLAADDRQQTQVVRILGQRYLGQRYELPVKVAEGPLRIQQVANDFHAAHEHMYGFARPDQPVELASVWLSVEVDLEPVPLPQATAASPAPPGPGSAQSRRAVIFAGQSHETPIYHRDSLATEATLEGPAIIEQLDSVTLLWPGQQLKVDRHGQLILGPLSPNHRA